MGRVEINHTSLILAVARELPDVFSKEDLAVACFQRFPRVFGMKNYPYPNTTAVFSKLQGAGGLVYQGFIVQHEDKKFSCRRDENCVVCGELVPPGQGVRVDDETRCTGCKNKPRMTVTDL